MRSFGSRSGSRSIAVAVAMSLGALGCGGAGAPAAPPAAAPRSAASATPTLAARSAAPAEAPPPLLEGDGPEVTPVPIAGSDLVRGRTTLKVHAPIARVRAAVLDFGHYADFMPYYRSSRVLGRTATGARDIYMEIEALHHALRLWVEIELPRPTIQGGVEIHEARFVKGNVKDFKAIWRLRAVDEVTTELALEVFLEPEVALPTALLNAANVGGSYKGATAMRARIEKERESESESNGAAP